MIRQADSVKLETNQKQLLHPKYSVSNAPKLGAIINIKALSDPLSDMKYIALSLPYFSIKIIGGSTDKLPIPSP
jgi:hypothetical protein